MQKEKVYYPSLDILRGLAIILMVQIHFVQNLSPREVGSSWLYDVSMMLGGIPAPLFSFLLGTSLFIWLQNRRAKGVSDEKISAVAFRRGAFLFFSGLLFAVAIWLPREVFNWDILTFLGASTLLLYAMRNLSIRSLLIILVAVLLISPPLRELSGYAAHWDPVWEEYLYDFTLPDVLLGFLLQGYFPMLPWIMFPLAGFIVGKVFFSETGSERKESCLFVWGGILAASSALLIGLHSRTSGVLAYYASPFTFYPGSTSFILGNLGLILIFLGILRRWTDQKGKTPSGIVYRFLERYSRFSLTVYIVHHVVHVWPLYVAALVAGESDPFWFYADAVGTPMALALAAGFILLFYPVMGYLQKRKRYTFEGLLRWFSET
ncbi:MAG: DUF1624 domain-containing protein [Spirochaetales bacterium]|nr:DUF1624 domain-containing protein [Spirochaetales bacterium]